MAPKDEKRAAALQSSYAKATAWLIAEYKEEFDTYRAALLKAEGFEWNPPLTAEQKDEAALREILARNPKLADQVIVKPGSSAATDPHS